MAVASDPLSDARFAGLDAAGLVELCSSLAAYGEAGGLSRELMLQVGSYGETRFAEDEEVLVAVARMYLHGGESTKARTLLVTAARRWPGEERLLLLLDDALRQLADPRTVEDILHDSGEGSTAPEATSGPRPSSIPPGASGSSATSATQRMPRVSAPPEVKRLADTAPMSEAAKLRALALSEGRGAPVEWRGRDGSVAPTPASGMPIVPRATALPGSGRARTAAAQVRVEEAARAPQVRTEINRRAAEAEGERGRRGGARSSRIRLLDPEDEQRRLDPYEIIGDLASGGMATVYLARLAGAGGFQRFVAIKRLHPHLAREEQFVQMFLDEARLAAAIHHPHVVPILEVGMSDLGHYVVMEFIEGDTLAGLLIRSLQRGVLLPAAIAVRIVLDALSGLHAAHQLTDADGNYLGLVHRDCTPQNILVGIDGSARITDFGVARAASRLAFTGPRQVKGKVAYLSPEQAHALELDRRSDLFTMGIVLWESLAGRPLFQGETEAATLSRLFSARIPPLQAFAPDLPSHLDDVCRRALAQDRNRRYRTAAEMGEALERAVHAEGGPGVASPRELGEFVEELMGAEIAAQREAVRGFLAQSSDGSPPPSRGPRTVRPPSFSSGPADSRASSARDGATAEPEPPRSEAPETPAPRGEKVPRISGPPEETTPETPPRRSLPPPLPPQPSPVEATLPAEPGPVGGGAVVAEPIAQIAVPAARSRAPLPSLRRLLQMRLSHRAGVLLVVVLVALVLSPLAYQAMRRRARGQGAVQTTAPP